MANTDRPRGFKPVRYFNNAAYTGQHHMYAILAADTTATFFNDLVVASTSADTLGLYGSVVQAAAADADVVGSIVAIGAANAQQAHVSFDPADLDKPYRLASTLTYVGVADDPWIVFEAQGDGTGTAAIAGENTDITVGSGNTTTGLSAMEIDTDTNTASTATIRLLNLTRRDDNVLGTNTYWDCIINEHAYKTTSGT